MAIYIERWEVMNNPYGNRIEFAYSDEQREQGLVNLLRHEHFKHHHVGAYARLLHVNRIGDTEKEDER